MGDWGFRQGSFLASGLCYLLMKLEVRMKTVEMETHNDAVEYIDLHESDRFSR